MSSTVLFLIVNIFIGDIYCQADQLSSRPARLKWGSLETHVKTNDRVMHLEEDSFTPGNILYTDGNRLMSTDGKTTDLIFGSDSGYAEGRSTQAQFRAITGFLQFNSTHLLLADNSNHCLRHGNRVTNTTSHFVGKCQIPGFVDGQYEKAQFHYPWSILRNRNNRRAGIIVDQWNRALRSLDLDTGDVKTLFKPIPGYPFGASFDLDKDNIFITFQNFLGRYNFQTSLLSQLTVAENNGGFDGPFRPASFGFARDILCMNMVCLVADAGSHKLRILDVPNQIMYSLCTGNEESIDGATTNCSLNYPESILLKSNVLYLGEKGAIRKIFVKGFSPCEDIAVKLPSGDKEMCLEVVYGIKVCFRPGLHSYRVPELGCTITINITKDMCETKPCLNSGICTATENNTYSCSCRDRWKGINCETDSRLKTRLDIAASYKLPCTFLSDFKELTISVAKKRYSQITQLSFGTCNQSMEYAILFSCEADILQVIWPTDCLFDVYSAEELERALTLIHENLRGATGSFLDLLIPSHMPSIIRPSLSQEGLPASTVLTPVCLDGLMYRNSTQTCQ